MKNIISRVTAVMLAFTIAFSGLMVAAETAPDAPVFSVREIFEEEGVVIEWHETERSIVINLDGTVIVLVVDEIGATVNNEPIDLIDGVFIENDRAYITVNDLSILFGLDPAMILMIFDATAELDQVHLGNTIFTAELVAAQVMDLFTVQGMTIALVDANTGFTWTQGFGLADSTTNTPVDELTLFNVASVSKTFTALALMQLVEAGLVDLDTPVVYYLPDFHLPSDATGEGDYRNITPRMLLAHASGMQNDIMGLGVLTHTEYNQNFMNDFLDIIAEFPMLMPELSVLSYANNPFTLAGVLIAEVMGYEHAFDGFVSFTNEHIFAALGMDLSTFALTDAHRPYVSQAYIQTGEQDVFLYYNALPAGGLFSNAHDMAIFMHMLLNNGYANGAQFVSAQTIEQMFTIQSFDLASESDRMIPNMYPGLGILYIESIEGWRHSGHPGNLVHYHSMMALDRETGLGVFVSVNSISGMAVPQIVPQLLLQTAIVELTGALELPTPDLTVTFVERDAAEFEAYVGMYVIPGSAHFGSVFIDDGVLMLVGFLGISDEPMALAPLSDGSFAFGDLEDGLRIWFESIDGSYVLLVGEFQSLMVGVQIDTEAVTNVEGIEEWIGTFLPVVEGNDVSLLVYAVVGVNEDGVAYMRFLALHGVESISPLTNNGDDNFGGIQFSIEGDDVFMEFSGQRFIRTAV